ncbi:MAG: drug/metabolite transporter (DMT)-like permease [Bradymonadia bacterium]|jgi:drug/metabolite transporter (DMT)-like permease
MGELAALGSSLVWACASILFSKLGKSMSGLSMNASKCTLALLFFIPTLLWREGVLWPAGISDYSLGLLGVSALVGLTLGDTAYFGSLIRLGPAKALLLTALVPPVTAILGFVCLDESLTLQALGGMALAIGGVTWVVQERAPDAAGERAGVDKIGIALGVLAAVCQASGAVLMKLADADSQLSALGVSVVRLALGVAGLLVLVALRRELPALIKPLREPRTLGIMMVATFLGTFMGIWLMNYGFLNAQVGVAATLNSTSPIWVLPLAAIFLHERISARTALGAVIAVAGVALLLL